MVTYNPKYNSRKKHFYNHHGSGMVKLTVCILLIGVSFQIKHTWNAYTKLLSETKTSSQHLALTPDIPSTFFPNWEKVTAPHTIKISTKSLPLGQAISDILSTLPQYPKAIQSLQIETQQNTATLTFAIP